MIFSIAITQYPEWNNIFCLIKFLTRLNGFKTKCYMQTVIPISDLLLINMENQFPVFKNKHFMISLRIYSWCVML